MPKLYAETPTMRSRQVMWDLVALAWVVLWVVLGRNMYELVMELAASGGQVADVGASLADEARMLATVLGDVPLIGPSLTGPLATLGDAAADLSRTGAATGASVERLAVRLGLIVGGLPIALGLATHLGWRLMWMRRAAAVEGLRDDPAMIRVLALRAVVNRSLAELREVSAAPVQDLDERPEILAAVELRALGLRAPT